MDLVANNLNENNCFHIWKYNMTSPFFVWKKLKLTLDRCHKIDSVI